MLKAFSKLPINQSVRILSQKEMKDISYYEMYQYFDMLPNVKDRKIVEMKSFKRDINKEIKNISYSFEKVKLFQRINKN